MGSTAVLMFCPSDFLPFGCFFFFNSTIFQMMIVYCLANCTKCPRS